MFTLTYSPHWWLALSHISINDHWMKDELITFLLNWKRKMEFLHLAEFPCPRHTLPKLRPAYSIEIYLLKDSCFYILLSLSLFKNVISQSLVCCEQESQSGPWPRVGWTLSAEKSVQCKKFTGTKFPERPFSNRGPRVSPHMKLWHIVSLTHQ